MQFKPLLRGNPMSFDWPMGDRYDDAECNSPVSPELDEYICDYVDGTMDDATRASFEEYLDANPAVAEHIRTLVRASHMLRACADQCPCVADDFQRRLRFAVEHEGATDESAGAWLDKVSSIVIVTSALTIICLASLAPASGPEPTHIASGATSIVGTANRVDIRSEIRYHADRPSIVRLGPSTPMIADGRRAHPNRSSRIDVGEQLSRRGTYLAASLVQ